MSSDFIDEPIYIGVDPGVKGAMTAISAEGRLIAVRPIISEQILDALVKYSHWSVFIEQQFTKPGDSLSRVGVQFKNYGLSTGLFEMAKKLLFKHHRITISHITPGNWQKEIHKGISHKKGPKERSKVAFDKIFNVGTFHDYAIDSALIAECGRQIAGKK